MRQVGMFWCEKYCSRKFTFTVSGDALSQGSRKGHTYCLITLNQASSKIKSWQDEGFKQSMIYGLPFKSTP